MYNNLHPKFQASLSMVSQFEIHGLRLYGYINRRLLGNQNTMLERWEGVRKLGEDSECIRSKIMRDTHVNDTYAINVEEILMLLFGDGVMV